MSRLVLVVFLTIALAPLAHGACFQEEILSEYMDRETMKIFWSRDMRTLEDYLLEAMRDEKLCFEDRGLELHVVVRRTAQGWGDCPYNVFGCYAEGARLEILFYASDRSRRTIFDVWEGVQEPDEAAKFKPTMRALAKKAVARFAEEMRKQERPATDAKQ